MVKVLQKFVAKLFGYSKIVDVIERQEKLNKYIITKDGIKKL